MIQKRLLPVLLFSLLLLFAFPESPSSHGTRTARALPDSLMTGFDAYVQSVMAESLTPGLALAIVSDEKILYLKGFGVRKAGAREPVDANTVFRLASVSKGFASVLAGMCVRDSLLHWDDRVTQYLPDFALRDPMNTRELTIRHVLSHTSGLLAHSYDSLIEDNLKLEEMAPQLREVPVACAVGKCYAYQNVAYSLIGPIIKNAAGRTYEELLTERIFKPLGMANASLSREALLASGNFASPHVMRRSGWRVAEIKDTYYSVAPAAGVNASVHDAALWLRALLGGMPEILPPEVVAQVSEPFIPTPREKRRFNWNRRIRSAHYGMGWRVFDYAGHKMVYHSGGVRGYMSQIAFLPEEKIGVVVLQNSWNSSPFVYEFFDRYLRLREYP
jgi:beta-lactamase class C